PSSSPSQDATAAPGALPRRKRRGPIQLYLYANRFVLVEGDVRYLREGEQGRLRVEIPPGASITEFSPQAPYRPIRTQSASGTAEIVWRDGRFVGLQASSGERIDVLYDASGRMRNVEGSDGQIVDYRYDRNGWLYAAVDRRGNSVTYQRASSGRG